MALGTYSPSIHRTSAHRRRTGRRRTLFQGEIRGRNTGPTGPAVRTEGPPRWLWPERGGAGSLAPWTGEVNADDGRGHEPADLPAGRRRAWCRLDGGAARRARLVRSPGRGGDLVAAVGAPQRRLRPAEAGRARPRPPRGVPLRPLRRRGLADG